MFSSGVLLGVQQLPALLVSTLGKGVQQEAAVGTGADLVKLLFCNSGMFWDVSMVFSFDGFTAKDGEGKKRRTTYRK